MNGLKRWMAVSALALTVAAPTVASANDAGMMMKKIDYSKADVMKKNGMELVALRQIAESLGYSVMWNKMDMSVTLTSTMMMSDGDSGMMDNSMTDKGMMDNSMTDKGMMDSSMDNKYMVKVMIGSKTATVDMKKQMLNDAPVIMNNKTYVSTSFVEMYLAGNGKMMK
ncbi:copper amine oxidase N-terminal domain-containing protein [Cohnella terricola]|uniref:Copper amine oxidase N-terminal domain-containing protein n=1 Tax=Cohnella terricola TaxID=1289167 RepID=A0A559JIU4_9BACL|nr:copper amine oxidase N-terminal domain-containing protein [Cohnella terricola]TVX99789.1 copper amine oxidase N-terminal domain-containing protein [Cohnella terricola]